MQAGCPIAVRSAARRRRPASGHGRLSMRAVDAVLFDFGGVFSESPFGVVSDYARELGATEAETLGVMFGDYRVDGDHPWHQVERGEISLEDARQGILALGRAAGIEVDIYQVFQRFSSSGGIRTALVERVRRLREDGYQLAIITNNIREFSDGWRSLLPVDELFDTVVDSAYEGVRKPNPEIFRIALHRLGGIEPSRSVFLDDFPGHVEAAEKLGMRGVLVGEDIAAAIATLDALLGEA